MGISLRQFTFVQAVVLSVAWVGLMLATDFSAEVFSYLYWLGVVGFYSGAFIATCFARSREARWNAAAVLVVIGSTLLGLSYVPEGLGGTVAGIAALAVLVKSGVIFGLQLAGFIAPASDLGWPPSILQNAPGVMVNGFAVALLPLVWLGVLMFVARSLSEGWNTLIIRWKRVEHPVPPEQARII